MCHLEHAREAAKSGYALSELIDCPGFFFVHKPDGHKYLTTPETCDCPAAVPCKHRGLVEISLRYVATMARKAARPRRRFFSAKRLQVMRAMAPMMAGHKFVPCQQCGQPAAFRNGSYGDCDKCAASALRERVSARMLADFGPA